MGPSDAPRPPSYAWDWLQRSRPVLTELARRLTGRTPDQGFVDEVRAAFGEDPFVRAVVLDTIAETAFAGRVPRHRPAGVTWDRGLSWWAATLAGTTRRDFEAGPVGGRARQPDLFATDRTDAHGSAAVERPADTVARSMEWSAGSGDRPRHPAVVLERRRIAEALRRLVAEAGGGDVPAGAVQQLISDLETMES